MNDDVLAPLAPLAPLFEQLKASGAGGVAIAVRYVPETEFHTRFLAPDGEEDRVMLVAASTLLGPCRFSGLLRNDEAAQAALRQIPESFAVFYGVVPDVYAPEKCGAALFLVEVGSVPPDHVRCDMLRELTIAWSNAVHKGQLVWQE